MRNIIRPLLMISTLCLLAYFALGAIVANVLTIPRRVVSDETPQTALGLTYEEVRFPSRGEAITLAGWYIIPPPERDNQRAVIFVHGKDGCRACTVGLKLAGALRDRGFHALVIDLRGHGASGDGRFTFGLRERHDIQGAVDWLLAKGFAPGQIGLWGESMGAASSIGAAADEPAIGALVADSSYAELVPVLEREFPKASGLPSFVLPGALLVGQFIVGEDITRSRPVEEIARIAPRPVLIIHSADDPVIPSAHSIQLANAAQIEPWIIPGTNHVNGYAHDPTVYIERIEAFFAQALGA
jgi:dipeptidyl aminopeptidase/acylaminoacyl peptidase